MRAIVQDVSGVVFPGETMLVLGRPEAGCSTVLRILANQREPYQEVHGVVQYAGLSSVEMERYYHSEAVYCADDDLRLPICLSGIHWISLCGFGNPTMLVPSLLPVLSNFRNKWPIGFLRR